MKPGATASGALHLKHLLAPELSPMDDRPRLGDKDVLFVSTAKLRSPLVAN